MLPFNEVCEVIAPSHNLAMDLSVWINTLRIPHIKNKDTVAFTTLMINPVSPPIMCWCSIKEVNQNVSLWYHLDKNKARLEFSTSPPPPPSLLVCCVSLNLCLPEGYIVIFFPRICPSVCIFQ